MTRLILGFLLGLIVGVWLTDRANGSAAIRQRYASVKASEPGGPTSFGDTLEDVLR